MMRELLWDEQGKLIVRTHHDHKPAEGYAEATMKQDPALALRVAEIQRDEALEALNALAAQHRVAYPDLTAEQAFAEVATQSREGRRRTSIYWHAIERARRARERTE